MAAPLKIFIVHAAADASYREELTKHLSPLKRSGAIEIASCGSIVAGDDVKTTLDKLLRSAELILLLVSADFFASDECDELMRRALARRDVNSATVVPILVRHYDLKVTPLRDIKPLPRDEKALKDRADRDEVWSAIATEIAGLPRRRVGS